MDGRILALMAVQYRFPFYSLDSHVRHKNRFIKRDLGVELESLAANVDKIVANILKELEYFQSFLYSHFKDTPFYKQMLPSSHQSGRFFASGKTQI